MTRDRRHHSAATVPNVRPPVWLRRAGHKGPWLLAMLAVISAVRASAPAQAEDYAMAAREVAPGVYAVITPARDFPNPQNKGWNSNAAFVLTGDGILVVDTGSSQAIGQALRKVIRGVSPAPIRWIVNTHGHGDHWLGNEAVANADTEIITSTRVAERIRNEQDYWADLFNDMTEGATGTDARARVPTTLLDGPSSRTLGGTRVELLLSGSSHSPGDVLVWLPESKTLVTGDVAYAGRTPGTFESDIPQWIRFLGELEALAPQTVIPGHGEMTDAAGVTQMRRFLEVLWNTVRRGYEQGLSDFELLPKVRAALADLAPYFPGLDKNLGRIVSHTYLQVEQGAF